MVNITATCMIYIFIYNTYIYINITYVYITIDRFHRIRLISKPPVPILLVFIPQSGHSRLSGHAAASPSPTKRYYYYYVTDWKKYFESPSNCQSTVCIYVYILTFGGLQSALFAKENNIIARVWVRCVLRAANESCAYNI